MIRERKKETKTDTVLLILVLLLAVFGLVMLFSISEYNGRVRFGDFATFGIFKSSSDPFSHLADPGKQKDYSWLLVYVQDNADTSSNCRTGRLQ